MKINYKKNICCRHCKNITDFKFVDLGSSPPSNEYLSEECCDKQKFIILYRFMFVINAGLFKLKIFHQDLIFSKRIMLISLVHLHLGLSIVKNMYRK